jgi:hypothetical protein
MFCGTCGRWACTCGAAAWLLVTYPWPVHSAAADHARHLPSGLTLASSVAVTQVSATSTATVMYATVPAPRAMPDTIIDAEHDTTPVRGPDVVASQPPSKGASIRNGRITGDGVVFHTIDPFSIE